MKKSGDTQLTGDGIENPIQEHGISRDGSSLFDHFNREWALRVLKSASEYFHWNFPHGVVYPYNKITKNLTVVTNWAIINGVNGA